MSGPIVRTGTTPEFWKNWDNVFGKNKDKAQKSPAEAATPETPAKSSKEKKGDKK